MHYKGHIITKTLPNETELLSILEKYRYDDKKVQNFSWDWYAIGGRYGGKIKIKFIPDNNEDNWFLFKNRNNKYFISEILSEIKENTKFYEELDYLKYMGLRENILYVDGGYFKDTIDFEIDDCFLVIDDEKNLYIRESWNGENFINDTSFDDKVKKLDLTDKFITIIDFHD